MVVLGEASANEFSGEREVVPPEGRTVFDVNTFSSELYSSLIAHMGDGNSRLSQQKKVTEFSKDPALSWPPALPIEGSQGMKQQALLKKNIQDFLSSQATLPPGKVPGTGSNIRQISYADLFNESLKWFPEEKSKEKIWNAVAFAISNHQQQKEVKDIMKQLQPKQQSPSISPPKNPIA